MQTYLTLIENRCFLCQNPGDLLQFAVSKVEGIGVHWTCWMSASANEELREYYTNDYWINFAGKEWDTQCVCRASVGGDKYWYRNGKSLIEEEFNEKINENVL